VRLDRVLEAQEDGNIVRVDEDPTYSMGVRPMAEDRSLGEVVAIQLGVQG